MNRILLIDDDIDDVGLFREALKRIAPSVSLQYFNEGEEALGNLLEEKNVLPDIIFLDINMPKVNGWEFLVSFREARHLKHVPVIIYSTSSENREIRKAKELGANGFITKPDSFTQLKEMLAAILAQPLEQLAETLESTKTSR
jgi:CheY-like chemotaxis protein